MESRERHVPLVDNSGERRLHSDPVQRSRKAQQRLDIANKVDPTLFEAIKKVTARRSRTVINHILKYGFITTGELKDEDGYDHPPGAGTERTSRVRAHASLRLSQNLR